MTPLATLFTILNAVAILTLPRRWALLPLLVGACYMTLGQGISIGPFRFTVIRLLVIAGVLRILARNERPAGGLSGLDWMMVAWGAWALLSSVFHRPPMDALVFRMGLVYNGLGLYFLIRILCQTTSDVAQLLKITAFLLVPVALEMISEKFTGRNHFALLGGVPEAVAVRNGAFRAQGPFGHAILAGTVGALCVPLMVALWHRHRWSAWIGLAASIAIVLCSASSGPLMTTAFGLLALALWRWRHLTARMRVAAVLGYIALDIVMKAPAYYLLGRIDLTGGSTGYHRAALIESSIRHLGEWWFAGTDYTRHWMPYGVSWSPDHADITNQYLQNGVNGGLPLMFLYIATLWICFRYVGLALRARGEAPFAERFLIWALGAALFSNAATGISVSYFDQSIVFLYLTMAAIGSLKSALPQEQPRVEESTAVYQAEPERNDEAAAYPWVPRRIT